MKNPNQTRVAFLVYHVAHGGIFFFYQVSSEMKGYSQDEGRRGTTVFLTHGTTEEGLDFVSVLQPVPHTGKLFQSGYLTGSTATWEGDKGMDAGRERERGDAREERGGERKEKTRERKAGVKKYINK